MNPERVDAVLSEYVASVDQAQKQLWGSKERRATIKSVNATMPMVNGYLRELAPDSEQISGRSFNDHVSALPRVRHALEVVKTWQLISGDHVVSTVPLVMMDPVVHSAAAALWEAGKFRQAVADAATSLTHYAQQRLSRSDVSDTPLMTEAFSSDPPKPGRPRLRCPGDHRLTTVKDQQNGARQIATGAFLAIRNPSHHMIGDWNPITAFHYLTILSQVAHYFRYWDVVQYAPPLPDFNEVMAEYQRSMAKQKPVTVPGKTPA